MPINIEPTKKQLVAMALLDSPNVRELLYGGAKGGGKTYLGCLWTFAMANTIIKHFKLKPQTYPIPIGFLGRRQGSDFTRSTLDVWKAIIPEEAYRIRTREQEIIINETVKFYYGGLDDKKHISKFNSGECSINFIDQAEEIEEERLVTELRISMRKQIDGEPLPYKILWTANPRPGWLKQEFIDTKNPGKVFLPALPYDNPHLPEGYIENMEEELKHMPQLLKAYRDGSWDVLAGADQIIQDEWIRRASEITLHLPDRNVIAVDPARFGDDQTVIYGMCNSRIIASRILSKADSNVILDKIQEVAFEMSAMGKPPTVIGADDTGGYGSGITDNIDKYIRLWKWECKYVPIIFTQRQKSGVPQRYYNRRAEIYMNASRMFANGEIDMDFTDYPELRNQLTQPRYDFKNGQTIISDKDEIKQKYGRSPDFADAYVCGLFLLRYAKEINKDDWLEKARKKQLNQGMGYMAS